jgi:hypothetical protein
MFFVDRGMQIPATSTRMRRFLLTEVFGLVDRMLDLDAVVCPCVVAGL